MTLRRQFRIDFQVVEMVPLHRITVRAVATPITSSGLKCATRLEIGMERGVAISYDRLEEVAARLKGQS